MTQIKLTSLSRDMVGDLATLRAEIFEDLGAYRRLVETVEIEIEGGARLSDAALQSKIEEIYHG